MKKFLNNFDYWKALPSLTTVILLGIIVSITQGEYMIWWMILASLPLIYLLACIKTGFEKKLEYLKTTMDWASSESDPIKQAMKMSAVAMKNANRCAIEAMYGIKEDSHHWYWQARFYEDIRKSWREELQRLIEEKKT